MNALGEEVVLGPCSHVFVHLFRRSIPLEGIDGGLVVFIMRASHSCTPLYLRILVTTFFHGLACLSRISSL
jgi:hypothetical protein